MEQPNLHELRSEVGNRFAKLGAVMKTGDTRAPRVSVGKRATLRIGDLALEGIVENASLTGAYFKTHVIVEVGEGGALLGGNSAAPIRVVWCSLDLEQQVAGLGLVFETASGEREILEFLTSLLATEVSA